LFSKRVDAVFSNDTTSYHELMAAKLPPEKVVSALNLDFIFKDLYLAVNKNTDATIVKALILASDKLKNNGEYEKIRTKWKR